MLCSRLSTTQCSTTAPAATRLSYSGAMDCVMRAWLPAIDTELALHACLGAASCGAPRPGCGRPRTRHTMGQAQQAGHAQQAPLRLPEMVLAGAIRSAGLQRATAARLDALWTRTTTSYSPAPEPPSPEPPTPEHLRAQPLPSTPLGPTRRSNRRSTSGESLGG